MKIEIDLNDIFASEEGVETLQESVKRQVIDAVSREIKESIRKKVSDSVQEVVLMEVKEAVKAITPNLLNELLDAEYIQVDRWGSKTQEPTTFRRELVKQIHKEMTYNKGNYNSDRNTFTRTVDDIVEKLTSDFKKSYNTEVDSKFTKDALFYAETKLRERLGIK